MASIDEHIDILLGGYLHFAHPDKNRNEVIKRTLASALIIGSHLANPIVQYELKRLNLDKEEE